MKGSAVVLLTVFLGGAELHSQHLHMTVSDTLGNAAVHMAHGTFEVRVFPQPPDDGGGPFSRVFMTKDLRGDLTATSKGHLLGAESTAAPGSGGYVALELVTGVLNGRRGSFILQHSGHMTRGVMSMRASVVPDSGTDELTGLAGTFTITVVQGEHRYAFEYSLPQ